MTLEQGETFGKDTVVQVLENLYGDKCIVWQLQVLKDEAVISGYVTKTEYAVNSTTITSGADSTTRLNVDVSSDVPEDVFDELVEPLAHIGKEDIIGYKP